VNDEMINLPFNESFTNGFFDLFVEDEDNDDISMTCESVSGFDCPPNRTEVKSVISFNQKLDNVSV
jgi:hypothetical protein